MSVTFTTQVGSHLFGGALPDFLKLQADLVAFFLVLSALYLFVINTVPAVYRSVLPAIL